MSLETALANFLTSETYARLIKWMGSLIAATMWSVVLLACGAPAWVAIAFWLLLMQMYSIGDKLAELKK